MWSCPLCQHSLHLDVLEKNWSCENKHSFDRAREGYVNLLPANKKRSSAPGDNIEMIGARRRIHSADIYKPLAEGIVAEFQALDNVYRVLDLGCGEGYYSHALSRAIPQAKIAAIDISKPAIRLAAKHYTDVNFAVASSFQLPVQANSQDVLVRIFAPSDNAEIQRVLRDEGCYLEVTPASRHLWALRETLYDAPKMHEAARKEIAGLQLVHASTVEYEIELDNALLNDLVAMTPFAYRGHREKRERLLTRESLSIQMEFSLHLFQK